ncbi:MAG: Gfo/Idh/MocA family oxidoreductase [Acidimicrobiia bacterium]
MLELALIGAGSMGANHARVAMGLRDARLSIVVDPDESRGGAVAASAGAIYHRRLESALPHIDAAIVAAPTHHHHRLAMQLLEAGIHVLVEKPISATREEATEMIDRASAAEKVLMVGHIERFNPVVLELGRLLTDPIHVTAQRISPYTPRIADGVTLDLMIHDLDLIASIARSPIRRLASFSQDVFGSDDLTLAVMEFESGMTASVTASRLGQDKVREMTITQREDYLRLDLIRQSVTVHRLGRIDENAGETGYSQSGIVELPFLRHRGEPLLLELGHFIDCILAGSAPRVTGEDGRRAIELVEMVKKAAQGERAFEGTDA